MSWRGRGYEQPYLMHSEDPRYATAKEALDRNKTKLAGKANIAAKKFIDMSLSNRFTYCREKAVPHIQKLFKEAVNKMPTKDTQFVYMLTELRKIIKSEFSNVTTEWLKKDISDAVDDVCTRTWLENIMSDLYKQDVVVGAPGSKGKYTNKLKRF